MKYRIITTAFGYVGVLASDEGLAAVTLPRKTKDEVIAAFGRNTNKVTRSPDFLPDLVKRLKDYFKGKVVSFPDKLDISSATSYQKAVWETARQIPYGETRNYGWIAEKTGNPKASRAVGQALGKNPLPIVIPCHRVIAGNGGMGGFTGGIDMKMRLIALESSGR